MQSNLIGGTSAARTVTLIAVTGMKFDPDFFPEGNRTSEPQNLNSVHLSNS
jgi:hypothetical protein